MTELVAAELGINVEFRQAVSLEDELLAEIREHETIRPSPGRAGRR